MREVERICNQLRRALKGPAWHGPSLMEALSGVDARVAGARPIEGAHSIWELTRHVAGWADVARRRIEGEIVEEPDEGDFPAESVDEEAWKAALARVKSTHEALFATAAKLTDETLDRPPHPEHSTPYVLLHGTVQHDLYHAGQIMLLKKAAKGERRSAR